MAEKNKEEVSFWKTNFGIIMTSLIGFFTITLVILLYFFKTNDNPIFIQLIVANIFIIVILISTYFMNKHTLSRSERRLRRRRPVR